MKKIIKEYIKKGLKMSLTDRIIVQILVILIKVIKLFKKRILK